MDLVLLQLQRHCSHVVHPNTAMPSHTHGPLHFVVLPSEVHRRRQQILGRIWRRSCIAAAPLHWRSARPTSIQHLIIIITIIIMVDFLQSHFSLSSKRLNICKTPPTMPPTDVHGSTGIDLRQSMKQEQKCKHKGYNFFKNTEVTHQTNSCPGRSQVILGP